MATAEQLKTLVRSYTENDDTRFYRVMLQLAATEAKKGHTTLARELKELVDEGRSGNALVKKTSGPIPIAQPRGELEGVITAAFPNSKIGDMVLTASVERSIQRVLREQRKGERLRAHGLSPRRKILLAGPPGTGKTMTAQVLAGELGLPLFTVRFEGLITRYLGETASKLRLVFEAMSRQRGVYLFDEFDAIGSHRAATNDVGEIRRILNTFLQLLEEEDSLSLIVAATNHPELLDSALFRRFDDLIRYENPDAAQAVMLMKNVLAIFDTSSVDWDYLGALAAGVSFAELRRACEDSAKDMILDDRQELDTMSIENAIQDRIGGACSTARRSSEAECDQKQKE